MGEWNERLTSEDSAWGVFCEACGLQPLTFPRRNDARMEAKMHRMRYDRPKPSVSVVRVRVTMESEPTR